MFFYSGGRIMNLHIMPDNSYSREFIEFVNSNFDKNQHCFCIITNNARFVYLDNMNYNNIINKKKNKKKINKKKKN